MKLLVYGLNLLNYLILIMLILYNLHNLSQVGLNICMYFLIASFILLVCSLIIYFPTKNNTLFVSFFINLFNLTILFPIILLLLF
ncbi:hypothetical protein BUY49_10150 [Staphylococcus devriesei]|nr:hypothetical protein BUY49_10150 [Staphylococcus devriesei]